MAWLKSNSVIVPVFKVPFSNRLANSITWVTFEEVVPLFSSFLLVVDLCDLQQELLNYLHTSPLLRPYYQGYWVSYKQKTHNAEVKAAMYEAKQK